MSLARVLLPLIAMSLNYPTHTTNAQHLRLRLCGFGIRGYIFYVFWAGDETNWDVTHALCHQ